MFRKICLLAYIAILSATAIYAQKEDDRSLVLPKLVTPLRPVYPAEARELGLGGRVTVRVVVGESGEVRSVDQPVGPANVCNGSADDPRLAALRNSVIDAVKQAKFTPATKDGKPVEITIWVSSTFDPIGGDDPSSEKLKTRKQMLDVGVVAGKARQLPKPAYPGAARAERAAGPVTVRVVIDESGAVFTAEAVSGHPLLRAAAVQAACKASFSQTLVEGTPVRVKGVITYNFVF